MSVSTGNKKRTIDNGRPLVHSLYENPLKPEEIEAKSFEAIDREVPDHSYTAEQWVIVRRMLHTTANFALLENIRFSNDAIDGAISALEKGCGIFSDSNMIRAGISESRLRAVYGGYSKDDIVCHVADGDVAKESKNNGLPRSLYAVRKAKEMLNGGIAVFGNAPTALMELSRMIVEDGIKPASVIAMPVGFVNVVESKEELMSQGVPYIAITGRCGGSPLAVSVIHSLCAIAVERKLK
ncbi:MAG: precorrin-8X methylmutase [Nitrospinota bacterium]